MTMVQKNKVTEGRVWLGILHFGLGWNYQYETTEHDQRKTSVLRPSSSLYLGLVKL